MPTPVTDPDILAQLNAPQAVTDPNVLSQLNEQPTFLDKLGQTWPARMAKDIYSGMTLPGDVYAGKTAVDVTDPQFMQRLEGLASVAPVGTLPSVTTSAPSVKQLIETGGKQIKEAVQSGAQFEPNRVQSAIDDIRSAIKGRRVSEDTHGVLDDLEQKVQTGEPITFADIDKTRDELLAVQQNAVRSTARTAATDLRSATIAKHGLDDVVRGTPEGEQYLSGMANVTGGKQAETLDKRLYRAELRSSAANSGQNIGNTIRSNVASMLLSPRESGGLGPELRQQAENVVYGSRPENFMRSWGNTLGGGGGLGRTWSAGLGGLAGYLASGGSPTLTGIAALGAPMIGSVLKHGANELAISHLEALSNAMRSGTPLGQVVNRGDYLGGVPASTNIAKSALIRALMTQSPYYPSQP
jgi:hypothetical protein